MRSMLAYTGTVLKAQMGKCVRHKIGMSVHLAVWRYVCKLLNLVDEILCTIITSLLSLVFFARHATQKPVGGVLVLQGIWNLG